MLVRWYLETIPRFTVPCEGNESRFYTVPTGNRPPCCRVVVHYTTAASRQLHNIYIYIYIIYRPIYRPIYNVIELD